MSNPSDKRHRAKANGQRQPEIGFHRPFVSLGEAAALGVQTIAAAARRRARRNEPFDP